MACCPRWSNQDVSIQAPAKGAKLQLSSSGAVSSFQPTPREGSELYCGRELSGRTVSIHAPVKGANLP